MFVGADMKFATASRMKPRWLVFAMMLPSQDILFVHYKVPTIMMSRRCDQNEKVSFLCSGLVCLSIGLSESLLACQPVQPQVWTDATCVACFPTSEAAVSCLVMKACVCAWSL